MITIRKTEQDDLKWVIDAESSPENNNYVEQWSFDKHCNSLLDNDIKHFLIIDANKNKVGYFILAGLENENNTMELRRLVITQKHKGYGKYTLKEILRLSFEEFNCHRLWLDVKINNTKAMAMYEKFGFKKEGLLRECALNNGIYESSYIYSILEKEYESNR